MADTYLYVIGWDRAGPVKIGFTTNPTKRVAQLQTAQPNTLEIFHLCKVETPKARIIENLIHKSNRRYKISGEWYDLTVEQAIAEVELAMIHWGDKQLTKHYVRNIQI